MNFSEEKETVLAATEVRSYGQLRLFAMVVAGLSVLFFKPLFGLLNYALHSQLYSHIPLIPFVSVYLLWRNKEELADEKVQSVRPAAVAAFLVGAAALLFYALLWKKTPPLNANDSLSLALFAFVSFVVGAYFWLLGKTIFFPVAFLFFLVPFPIFVTDGMEAFFQHTSASAAHVMLQLSDAPVLRRGLEFRLPQITIAVAPECSGIRSTLVLFITSLIAGQLFLKSAWKKALLVCFVIPLAIVRNGFRIFTISQLCIHRGPEMIDSVIHRRGGPLFFLLSLVPFFLLLFFLQRSALKRQS